ncbi:unnamed protein product, partial [Phaeothamnion confervicola]
MFDKSGDVVDAAYYNQLHACGGAVKHSGDSIHGGEETIRFDLDNFPAEVAFVVVVVCSYERESFASVESAVVELRALVGGGGVPEVLHTTRMSSLGDYTAYVLCTFRRVPSSSLGWVFRESMRPTHGAHFQECLPTIHSVVDAFLPKPSAVSGTAGGRLPKPKRAHVDREFPWRKGDTVRLPVEADEIRVGLGWRRADTRDMVDLDASAVLADATGAPVAYVWWKHREEPGVRHLGDNLIGHSPG